MKAIDRVLSPWKRARAEIYTRLEGSTSRLRKSWRRSWAGKTAWPWLRHELEVIGKVSGVLLLSLWAKRLVEQFLGKKVLNEPILRGEMNGVVRGIEGDVEERRSRHARRRPS